MRRTLREARGKRVVLTPALEGVVVAVGDRWAALWCDRWVLVRVSSVVGLEVLHDEEAPALPELVDLYDVRTVLFTASSLSPVLEVDDRSVEVFRIGDKKAHLVSGRPLRLKQVERVALAP